PSLRKRDMRVDAVQLVQIDEIGPETLQAVVDGRSHVLGTSIARNVELHPIGGETDLRGEKRALAMPDERVAHELFVRERPVDVGGVDEIRAEVQRAMD